MLVSARPVAPLGIAAHQVAAALRDGARLVDVRSQADRNRDGVIPGAVALGADVLLDRLTPGSPLALRDAASLAPWIIVATDAHDAEWLTWHLHARGVSRARFLLGGADTMRALRCRDRFAVCTPGGAPSPALSAQDRRDMAIIAAH